MGHAEDLLRCYTAFESLWTNLQKGNGCMCVINDNAVFPEDGRPSVQVQYPIFQKKHTAAYGAVGGSLRFSICGRERIGDRSVARAIEQLVVDSVQGPPGLKTVRRNTNPTERRAWNLPEEDSTLWVISSERPEGHHLIMVTPGRDSTL
ncbi:hypothetical protein PV10_02515 [Exophiala mesophila]|uniref:Uncharacterized protein n=1 Tax=Exophiala mesophila TaxID=212818 RepID=A0A0D2A6X5_EXOME|nr:uncharacterized protein PV10_02515 [Exophiala mesophila]KIV94783.1 hypothetical protein PV10_02515 [Exophiala mesophila]